MVMFISLRLNEKKNVLIDKSETSGDDLTNQLYFYLYSEGVAYLEEGGACTWNGLA